MSDEWFREFTTRLLTWHFLLIEDHLLDYHREPNDQCLACVWWHLEKIIAYNTLERVKFEPGCQLGGCQDIGEWAEKVQSKLPSLTEVEALQFAMDARETRYKLVEAQGAEGAEVAMSTAKALYPAGCELVEIARDKCHSQSPFKGAKGCDLYLTELFGQVCRNQPPGHILGAMSSVPGNPDGNLVGITYTEPEPELMLIRTGPTIKGVIPPEFAYAKVQTKLVRSKAGEPAELPQLNKPEAIQPLFRLMRDADQEWLVAIYADTKLRPVGVDEISIGSRGMSLFPMDAILRSAILTNASVIFMAHNHPSGDPTPSQEDRLAFEKLKEAAGFFDITAADMLIVGRNADYSISAERQIPAPEKVAMSSNPDNPWAPPPGAIPRDGHYEIDGHFLSAVHGIALSPCEVEHSLAAKLDSCVSQVQERNVERGCPAEGLGTAECPLSYAVCRASISQPVCSKSNPGTETDWEQPTWCPGIAAADKELRQASRALTTTKSRLTDIRKKLSTALNICAGQAEMFEQPLAVLDPYGSRCRSPETGQWIPSDECGFEPVGIKTTALGAGGLTHYEFEFHIVEGHSLVVSHDPFTFVPNPDYPKNLQPRLRERLATKAQVEKIAANIEPDALLTDFHVLDRGAPIVGPDLVVEAGNGRVMALLRAYESHPESYRNYRDRLVERVRDFGLRVQDVDGVSLAILVRIRLTEVDRTAFTQEANAMATIAPSAIENARTDAEKITIGMIQELRVSEDESIEDALRADKNLPFARRFLQTLPDEVQASLVDAKGMLNRDGVHRMAMAIFVSAFQGDNGLRLAEKAFESIDMDIRNAVNAIARSLGSIAQAENLIRTGDRDSGLTIGDDLAQAVSVYSAIKRTPALTVEKYLAQEQMFERELTDFQEGILILLEKYRRSPKKLGRVFAAYAEGVIASPPPAQTAMFPEAKISKQELWEKAVGQAERELEAPTLFQDDPLLDEISRQFCSMGQREHGFTICSREGELLRGPESVGHRHGVTMDISCPKGSAPIGTYHSHPNSPILSEQDEAEMVRLGLPVACVGVPDSGVSCYLISRCGVNKVDA